MPEGAIYQHFQTVEISGWIRNIEVKPYHRNEINTSEKKNRTREIGFSGIWMFFVPTMI